MYHSRYGSKEKIPRAEALAKPLGLSYLTTAAKGNSSSKTGNKNCSEDGWLVLNRQFNVRQSTIQARLSLKCSLVCKKSSTAGYFDRGARQESVLRKLKQSFYKII